MDTASSVLTDRSRASIHVYIREDIKGAQRVKFDVFVEAIFGLTPTLFAEWVSIIKKEKWHEDDQVSEDLEAFCRASTETGHYQPLSNIVNRIMFMAHGRLPGVPDVYPIDDICVRRNDPLHIQPIAAHGDLGAKRKPDLLTLRGKHAVKLRSPKSHKTSSPCPPVEAVAPLAADRRPRKKATSIAKRRSAGRKADVEAAKTGPADGKAAVSDGDGYIADEEPISSVQDPSVRETPDTSRRKSPGSRKKPGVRWVDDIMNWELKGSAVLLTPLALLRDDRTCKSAPAASTSLSSAGGEKVAREQVAIRRVARVSIERASTADSTADSTAGSTSGDSDDDSSVSAGTKRRRVDDDLIHHIRRPEPPAHLSNLTSEEILSYDLRDAAIQTGSYALETLACTFGTRLFCVNVLLQNDRLYFWYYDACGFVYTESISLIDDFEKAAAVIVGLACSTPEQLGALPNVIKPPRLAPYPQNWPPENLNGHTLTIPQTIRQSGADVTRNVHVTLKDSVFAQYILAGRRTFVYTIKTKPDISKDPLIIKFSYQVNTRRKEHELIDIAQKAGVEHLPTVHAWGDLWKMSDGVRAIFYEKEKAEYEDRTLRSIVYNKYLPLETLFPSSPESIPLMAYQMLDCLHDLRYKANILHRDVSVNNVMYEYRDNRLYFILIDFDMATVVSDDPHEVYVPSSKHRTGTLAFMAVNLIRDAALSGEEDHIPIAHMVCHDNESIFWLCFWCTLILVVAADQAQRERHLAIVRAWETKDLFAIAYAKRDMRIAPMKKNAIILPDAAVKAGLLGWFMAWQEIWASYEAIMIPYDQAVSRAEMAGLEPPPFDHETVGGVMTRDNLKRVLTAAFPDPYSPPVVEEPVAEAPIAEDPVAEDPVAEEPVAEEPVAEELVAEDADVIRGADAPRHPPKKAPAARNKGKAKKAETAKRGAAAKKATAAKERCPSAKEDVRAAAKKAAKKTAVGAKKTSPQKDQDASNDIRARLRPRKVVRYY